MAMKANEINEALRTAFPHAIIELKDLVGDGDHFEVHIKDASFTGLSRLQQHKLVYKALGDVVGNQLHALSIKTYAK